MTNEKKYNQRFITTISMEYGLYEECKKKGINVSDLLRKAMQAELAKNPQEDEALKLDRELARLQQKKEEMEKANEENIRALDELKNRKEVLLAFNICRTARRIEPDRFDNLCGIWRDILAKKGIHFTVDQFKKMVG